MMKKFIKKLVVRNRVESLPIELKGTRPSKGNVLLSYGTTIYKRMQEGKGFIDWHSTSWQNYQISKAFLERGYDVDVIDYHNPNFVSKRDYAVFIDVMTNMERLSKKINPDCIKVYFPAFSHWIFNNAAEYDRLAKIRDRRSVALTPRVLLQPNDSLEMSDLVLQRGNSYTRESFAFADKPEMLISSSSTVTMDWPSQKNFGDARKSFIWLGSRGAAHKGLDLVLEAFKGLAEYKLIICGNVTKEKDFCEAYFEELFNTDNIEIKGWVNTSSIEFHEIANTCVALVFPSCAELSSGSVIACMHAGLIPIISASVGVDTGDFGYVLKESSIEEIKSMVCAVAESSDRALRERSHVTWEFARKKYTKESYLSTLERAIDSILGTT
jgi:glycosyltransferase involved in cell wall biosynthesis